MTTEPASSRIPLNTLAIPFGLIGYAGSWTAAGAAFGWTRWIVEPFWVIASGALIWLIVAHTIRGLHVPDTLLDQLRHPVQGPIAAILPLSVILIGAHISPRVPVVGKLLVYSGTAVGVAFAAWLTTQWIRHQVPVESIHGGYFLPTVAGGFIAAGGLSATGNTTLAIAPFSMGVFFWIVIFTIILARLVLAAPLPGPLVPTLAILIAPPAVGGMAWFAINGRTIDWLSTAFLGSTSFMALIQVALIPTYRRLTFSLGFWSFTFSGAALMSQTIVLSDISRYPGWRVVVIAALAAVSILIIAIAAKSMTAVRAAGGRTRHMERQLTSANRSVEQL